MLRIQLRVALTVGPVVPDEDGISGEAIIEAARLLEAPESKRRLVDEQADLGVIVSAFLYDTVIKHGPGLVDPETYSAVNSS